MTGNVGEPKAYYVDVSAGTEQVKFNKDLTPADDVTRDFMAQGARDGVLETRLMNMRSADNLSNVSLKEAGRMIKAFAKQRPDLASLYPEVQRIARESSDVSTGRRAGAWFLGAGASVILGLFSVAALLPAAFIDLVSLGLSPLNFGTTDLLNSDLNLLGNCLNGNIHRNVFDAIAK